MEYFPKLPERTSFCVLCGEKLFGLISVEQPISEEDLEYFSSRVKITDAVCLGCTLVQRVPMPSAGMLAQFYSQQSNKFGNFILFDSPNDQRFRTNQANWICSHLDDRGKLGSAFLLEVGAFNGRLLAELVDRGIQAFGIETSYPIEFADERAQENLFPFFLDDKFCPTVVTKDPITDIVASHVLEHTQNPAQFLMMCSDLILGRGSIFIEVPNVLQADSQDFTPFTSLEHTYNFTPRTLEETARRAGLVMTSLETVDDEPVVGSVIRAVFCRGEPESRGREANSAFDDLRAILQIIQDNRDAQAERDERATKVVHEAGQREIVIYGAGVAGYRVLQLILGAGGTVAFFVDSDEAKQGKKMSEIQICEPGRLESFSGIVLVATNAYAEEIYTTIRAINSNVNVLNFFGKTA
jgi:hypothetical protein